MKSIALVGIGAVMALFFINIYLKKGGVKMLDLYVGLVVAGRRTCNEENKKVVLVPAKWRAAALEDLEALGLNADGNQAE